MIARLTATALFCLGLFCLAQAQVPMTGAGKGAPGSGGTTPVTWLQTDSFTNAGGGTPITWTGAAIGADVANRVIVFFWSAGTTVATGVTIGGVTATLAIDESTTVSGLDIWYATGVTGTTANIVVSTGGGVMIDAIAVVGSLITTTSAPNSTNSSANASGPSVALSLTVPSNGIGLWWGVGSGGIANPTWTTITLDKQVSGIAANGNESNYQIAGATSSTFTNTGAAAVHTVGATWQP